MSDLSEFLLARLDEWQAAAQAASEACLEAPSHDLSDHWEAWVERGEDIYGHKFVVAAVNGAPVQATRPTAFAAAAPHIAAHDPARVLAQVAAMREIVERCQVVSLPSDAPESARTAWDVINTLNRGILRALASIWADTDGYDPEWGLG